MSLESKISNIAFFPSVKNGFFDYSTHIKSDLKEFIKNITKEPSPPLLEYLCYKIIKKNLLEDNSINNDIILISDNFFSLVNCKNIFRKITKKHIVIFLQNKNNQKWNLILFLNFKEQIDNYININNKKPIIAKIISSNLKSDEDNKILSRSMDNLGNIFDFKFSDNIKFEIDSINISNQVNSSIFLINFIEGLISHNNDTLYSYIQKLYNASININNNINDNKINYINYFNSFNERNKIFDNILSIYENELNEYLSNKVNNVYNNKKYLNKNKEILKNEMTQINAMIRDNNVNKNNKNNKINDFKEDYELNSEDEVEVLEIMEKERIKSKKKLRAEKRKMKYNLYNQKLKLENTNIYKEVDVIKEEDNESSSESINLLLTNKSNIKEKIIKNNIKSEKLNIDNKIKNYHNEKSKLKIKNNYIKEDIIGFNTKEDEKNPTKKIKKSILKELEEAIKEFELDEKPTFKAIETDTDGKNNNIINPFKSKLDENKKEKNIDIYKIIKNKSIEKKKFSKAKKIIKKKKNESMIIKNNSNNKNIENFFDQYKKNRMLINDKFSKESFMMNKNFKKSLVFNNYYPYNDKNRYKDAISKSFTSYDIKNKTLKENHINKQNSHNYIKKKLLNVNIKKNNCVFKIIPQTNLKKKNKGKNSHLILASKQSNNSQKSTSYKSEDSYNLFKLMNQDMHLKKNASNELEIKIEKSNNDFPIIENYYSNRHNSNLSLSKGDKHKEIHKRYNTIKIEKNKHNYNKINNIKKLDKNNYNSDNIIFDKIKKIDNNTSISNEISLDTYITNNNENNTLNNKHLNRIESDLRTPKLKDLSQEFLLPIGPKRSDTFYINENNFFDETKINKLCGCIEGKKDEICNIY